MAKKQTPQDDLSDALRSSGMRKKVARALSKASGKAAPERRTALSASADDLREVAATIDERAIDPQRSQAAKQAARTRERNAEKRSQAAQRSARTRAKST